MRKYILRFSENMVMETFLKFRFFLAGGYLEFKEVFLSGKYLAAHCPVSKSLGFKIILQWSKSFREIYDYGKHFWERGGVLNAQKWARKTEITIMIST